MKGIKFSLYVIIFVSCLLLITRDPANADFWFSDRAAILEVNQQFMDAVADLDCFPKEYTDYIICQIAIGRLKKGKVEGYLPMEAMEIAMPSGMIMDVLSGGEYDWKDRFDEEYGEYFDNDEE